MKKFELKIEILNEDYVNELIVSLVRQGYSVYLNETDNIICCTITENELTEIVDKGIKK